MSKYGFKHWETMYAGQDGDYFTLTGKHSDDVYLCVHFEDIKNLADLLHGEADAYLAQQKQNAQFRNEPIDDKA